MALTENPFKLEEREYPNLILLLPMARKMSPTLFYQKDMK
jgi:hypothetical protein